MAIGTKTPKFGGKKAVRQMRGPGMNLGLKKPRYGKFYSESAEKAPKNGSKSGSGGSKSSTKGEKSSSYLGDSMLSGGGKSRVSDASGKQLFSKIFRGGS